MLEERRLRHGTRRADRAHPLRLQGRRAAPERGHAACKSRGKSQRRQLDLGKVLMNELPDDSIDLTSPPRRRRLGRSVFILPSIFTVGNIFCGYFAIISTMRGNYDHAAQAIGIAIVLDMLDGRIARMMNSATDFGLQFDSLADVISFGI